MTPESVMMMGTEAMESRSRPGCAAVTRRADYRPHYQHLAGRDSD
ncbi:Uncharacterised protein [Salmonella enterica subsp. enterica serovar Sanjuan]|uniref:Uncharacterized protein n=1 Tax=Salmonella enterica subsp. enterica serovar Sanjuan TaxID=1160765 RepID=A0A3S4F8M9_SALET|nr:Uncharacterised protein [Salmonella enterica subsp. enterica serovar Sanjuan]